MQRQGVAALIDIVTLPLHEERLLVTKRVARTLVRATRTTTERSVAVEEDLPVERVVVTRVPIGRVVEEMPPIREENGVTIVPIVEEEMVMVRRLTLTEEVRFERVRSTIRHVETVVLRREDVTVTRTAVPE